MKSTRIELATHPFGGHTALPIRPLSRLQRARSKSTSYEVDENRTRDPSFGGHTALPTQSIGRLSGLMGSAIKPTHPTPKSIEFLRRNQVKFDPPH